MEKNKINIGIIGLGVVGKGVLKILSENKDLILKRTGRDIVIKKAAARTEKTLRESGLPKEILTTNPLEVVNDKEVDVIIELIGGYSPAKELIEEALKKGKHVVTANKEVIAKSGYELLKLANSQQVYLRFEASAVGGVPIIASLYRSLTSYDIERLIGIINGTTNYILTQMYKKDLSFDKCLKEAQKRGYAEADPTKDIEGYDATYKITILASLAFGAKIDVDSVYREGITNISPIDIKYADSLNYRVKLLSIASKSEEGIDVRVHPMLVSKSHPLANVEDVYNAVFTEGKGYGKLMFSGPGAGSLPAASMVVSDLVDIAKLSQMTYIEDPSYNHFREISIIDIDKTKNAYYLRLRAVDRPGVLALIANSFAVHKVSFASVIQKETFEDYADVVFLTHETEEFRIQGAISSIKEYPEIKEIASLIRVLKD